MKPIFKHLWPVALLLATAALFAVTGCQLEEDAPLDSSRLREMPLTIEATYEDVMSSATKTVLRMGDDNKQHVYWVPGDAISLFYGSGTAGGSKFTSQATSETRVTNFSGKIGVVTGGDEIGENDTYFWGLYPYDATAECDGQTVTVNIATLQEGAPDTFASGFAPSLGHAKGLMLAFRNIYSGLYFTVTQPGFQSMTLRANNGEVITGRAKIGIDSNNNPELREVLSGESYVTVTAPTSEGFEVGKKYYVLFFPRTLTGGFTAELYSMTQKGTFRVNSNVPFARNQISSIVNLDSKSQFETLTVTRASFPDEHFANYVFDNFDTDHDGELSAEERNAVTTIRVCTDTIASVKGIEFFQNLQRLYAPGTQYVDDQDQYHFNGQLTSLDVSANPNLRLLQCDYNRLPNLVVSNNPLLTNLYCRCNLLTEVDVSSNTNLTVFWCGGNQLTSIDVSNNPNLQSFSIYNNQITSLNLSGNANLSFLECSYNPLGTLDLSANTLLETVECECNQLTSINVSGLTGLQSLNCSDNSLTSLSISDNVNLLSLKCSDNEITSLSLSNSPSLINLNFAFNNLNTIDLTNNVSVQVLQAQGNNLGSIDVTNMPDLLKFYVWSNPLGTIDVTQNPELTHLDCEDTGLYTLDVSHNPKLEYLYCCHNLFSDLDVSANPLLDELYCNENPNLTKLYLLQGQTIDYLYKDNQTEIVYVNASVAIDETTFPDPVFRSYVSTTFDGNGDGVLSWAEQDAVICISIVTDNVGSLEGIGYFKNLAYLYCNSSGTSGSSDNQTHEWTLRNSNGEVVVGNLTTLDLSGNPALVDVWCLGNQLTSIILSGLTELRNLYCSYNKITSLDLSDNVNLMYLECNWNQLSSLVLTNNTSLLGLWCMGNWLEALNVSSNTDLNQLNCGSNRLTALDVRNCPALTFLQCTDNSIASLNVTANPLLQTLYVSNNLLTTLDITRNLALVNLECYNNNLSEIDMSLNLQLTDLGCSGNPYLTTVWVPVGFVYNSEHVHKDDFTVLREKASDNGGKNEGFTIGGGGVWD